MAEELFFAMLPRMYLSLSCKTDKIALNLMILMATTPWSSGTHTGLLNPQVLLKIRKKRKERQTDLYDFLFPTSPHKTSQSSMTVDLEDLYLRLQSSKSESQVINC